MTESGQEHPLALTPVQRLQQSRERMRRYLLPAERRSPLGDTGEQGLHGLTGKLGEWLDQLRGHPVAGAVIEAVQSWWAHHPLRSVADLGGATARELAEPLVRRHPVASVGVALLVGALAMRLRPWRWVLKPALFAGLTTQVVTHLMHGAPLEFVLDALTRLKPRREADPDAAAAASEQAAATSPIDDDVPLQATSPTPSPIPSSPPSASPTSPITPVAASP